MSELSNNPFEALPHETSNCGSCEVALLWPTATIAHLPSALTAERPLKPREEWTPAERAWEAVEHGLLVTIRSLQRWHWPFGFWREGDAIPEGTRAVLVASVPLLEVETFELLHTFLEGGGFLLGIDPLPVLNPELLGDSDDEVRALFRHSNALVLPPLDDDDAFGELLDDTLTERIGRSFLLSGEGSEHLRVTQQSAPGEERLVLRNPSATAITAQVELAAEVPLEVVDVDEQRVACEVAVAEDRQRLTITIAPGSAVTLIGRGIAPDPS